VASHAQAFLGAVLATAIALGLALLLEPLIEPDFSPLFLGAVALCAWRWETRAGLLSALLSVPSLLLLLLPPHYTLTILSWAVWLRILSFLSTAGLIIWLIRMSTAAQRALAGSLGETRAREERFRAALLKSPVIVFHQSADLRYTWVFNPLPAYTDVSLSGKLDSDLFPPSEAGELTRIKRSVLSSGAGAREEVALTTQDGVRTFDLAIEPFRNSTGETTGLIGVAVDITERRRTEEQLRHSGEQLRRLAAYLHFVHESQCAMTSREIQNDITQMLAALQLQLTSMADGLLDGDDPSEAVESLKTISGNLVATIEMSERISTDLRPSILDNLGLAAAIEWQARRFQLLTGVSASAGPLDDVDMSPEVSTAVFRIVQETLTNVARHAGASHVGVSLRRRGTGSVLEIHDDGKGITQDELADPASLGLLGMDERARSFGGRIAVEGTPGQGTTLRLEIPDDPGSTGKAAAVRAG
jgi:PAS domain S-box-containing protein